MPYFFEFPGGKIEEGESPENAILREIKEELAINVQVVKNLPSVTYSYSDQKVIRLFPFLCLWVSGEIHLLEHEEIQFLTFEDLDQLTWAQADIPVYEDLQERKAYYLRVLEVFQAAQ